MNSHPGQAEFKTIVTAYQEKVRNTCFRFVRNREDAEDLAQEVFMQVFESLDRFRQDAQLGTWIYRITVNKSLDFIRRRKRKKRVGKLVSLFDGNKDDKPVDIPAPFDPARELDNAERKEILDRALDRLPEKQRTAIILSKYEGYANREIAAIMDLSVSAEEALIHRAKENLRKLLFEYFEKK